MQTENEYITKSQVAERFQVTPRTVEAWMEKRLLPFQKIGRTVRFHWPSVVEFVNEQSAKNFAAELSNVSHSKELLRRLAVSARRGTLDTKRVPAIVAQNVPKETCSP
jgi:excisionase family DNA binding protein